MTPDAIIGRVLFTDGILRPVFVDAAGNQYVIDRQDRRVFGVWILVDDDDDADVAVVVNAPGCLPHPPVHGNDHTVTLVQLVACGGLLHTLVGLDGNSFVAEPLRAFLEIGEVRHSERIAVDLVNVHE